MDKRSPTGAGEAADIRSSGGLYRRLGRNMAWLAGGTGAAALFNMLAIAVLARALSPTEFGTLVLLQTSALFLSGLMSFATQQPVIQIGSAALRDGDLKRLGQVVLLGLVFDVVAALIAFALGIAILLLGNDLLEIPEAYRGSAALFATSLLFTPYLTSNGIFRLFDRFPLLSVLQAGTAAVTLVLTILLYLTGAGFSSFAWLCAGSLALTSQVQLWMSIRLLRGRGVRLFSSYGGIDRSDLKTFLAYCWGTWGMASTETVRANGDSLLVGGIVGVEAVGVYNVAKQVAGIVRKLTTIYASAAFPEFATLAAHRDAAGAQRLRHRMIAAAAALGAIGVIVAVALGRPFLSITFGEAFIAGYVPFVILVAAAVVQLISHTYSINVQAFVGPGRLFFIYLAATGVFILTAPVMTIWLSTAGTAAAQLLFVATLILICHLVLRASSHGTHGAVAEPITEER